MLRVERLESYDHTFNFQTKLVLILEPKILFWFCQWIEAQKRQVKKTLREKEDDQMLESSLLSFEI